MRPNLFELFGEPVPAYFTLLLIGFGFATWLAARRARQSGRSADTLIDLGLFAVLWGVAGGRVLHVFADGFFWDYVHMCTDPSLVSWHIPPQECAEIPGAVWDAAAQRCHPTEADCFAWAKFWRGGLAYYGGLIGAAGFGLWFLKKERFPVLHGFDLAAMVIPLGLFFGRLGCFFGGCCFGRVDHEHGLVFPAWSPASRAQWREGVLEHAFHPSHPVLPTQLYEAAGSLAIAAIAMLVIAPRKRFHGQVALFAFGAYAILRFLLEYVRADDRGEWIFGLTTSQLVSLGVFAILAWAWRAFPRMAAAQAESVDEPEGAGA